jgi:D-3-phosphoglycerate dehydrogenase / 2-oxoglutarate reductase
MASEKKNIIIADRFAQDSLLYLQQKDFFNIEVHASLAHVEAHSLGRCHGLIVRSKAQINDELLRRMPQLQVIVTATSGFDHIDLDATRKWGITTMHCPTANVESAAQLTFSLLLNSVNKIHQAHKQVKGGEWNRDLLTSFELKGRTLGVVGLGRIGSRVAQMAKSFGMDVIAFDPYQEDSHFELLNVERVAYEEVLKSSDVLTFHVPKTLETMNMLNRSHFEYIHRGVILINCSRGGVINEADLCEALEKGWIGAAALDVFEKEPLQRTSKLLNHNNVILTPHIGAQSEEAFYKASQVAAHKVLTFFEDGSTTDTLPPKAPWYGATPFKSE